MNIARSDDEGRSWGQVVVPHRDRTLRQHGFVTLLPVDGGRLMAIWLDGRNHAATGAFAFGDAASDAMQLRTTILEADGSLSDDTLLDARTCTCCQTSAHVTGSGCGQPKVLAISRTGRTIGFPRMVLGGDGVYIAWTAPGEGRAATPDENVKIRMVVAKLGAGQ